MIRGLLLVLAAASCADDGGPRLDSVTPSAAARNAMVTVSGQRLCGATSDCTHAGGEIVLGVSLPQVHTNVISYDDDNAVIVIPAVAAVGATHLIATVDGRSSNALPFEVLP